MKTTKQQLLTAAVEVAAETHYLKVNRDQIAARVGVTSPLVQYYWKTMGHLKRAVVGEAIRCENLTVLAQAVGAGDSRVSDLDPELKSRVIDYISR